MAVLNSNDTNFIERFLNAFKTIGGNELGFIDYASFKRFLSKNITAEEKSIFDLIVEEEHVREGKLDFISLCFSILSVKTVFNSFSSENGKIPLTSPRINTRTFTKNKGLQNGAKTNEPKETNEKSFSKSVKGMLFSINENLLGHRYQLELLETSNVEVFAKGFMNKDYCNKVPIEVLVFQEGKKKLFITSSSVINNEGYCSMKTNLKKGRYVVIPVLLKWDQDSRTIPSIQNLDSLLQVDEESNKTFTPLCERVLKQIFDAIDLDGNDLLSQSEFDFFIRHTSGETAGEEWATIEDNFLMKNGQLTFEGFLELYRLVIQTDLPDMLNMFQQMGMNENFEFKKSLPFTLTVNSETAKFNLHPLPISSYVEVSEKVFKKTTVEQGSSSKIKNMNDLFLFKHFLPHRATFVVQNQSHSKVKVNLDCRESTNCESHRNNLEYTVEISPRTSMIAHHLFPADITKNWNVKYKESFKQTAENF